MDQQTIREEIEKLYTMAQSAQKQLRALTDRLDEIGQNLERLSAMAEHRKADVQAQD